MGERFLDISEQPARLSIRHRQLVIGVDGSEQTTPLNDVSALVVSNPAVSYTQGVLAGICEAGGALVVCDEKHLPIGMLVSLLGHTTQGERLTAQAEAPPTLKKRLWQQIVRSKVQAQGACLRRVRGEDFGLFRLARDVRSVDTSNIEGQAARRYWPALFGTSFHRDRNRADQNRLLNYGYAVLRAMAARAICGAGLHPSLGLHHHNRYDAYCLADDLMEPYRPAVDRVVLGMCDTRGPEGTLDAAAKRQLIGWIIGTRHAVENETAVLPDILAHAAASLAQVYLGRRRGLCLPVV